MVIFQNNLYIFRIHLWTMFYPKPCYKDVVVYSKTILKYQKNKSSVSQFRQHIGKGLSQSTNLYLSCSEFRQI